MNTQKNIEYIYHKIPIEIRPKLYKQMLEKPYDLLPLNLNELFIYLQTKKKTGKMLFKFLVEFLNIFNTLILFYSLSFYLQKNENDRFIFYFIDLTIILSSVGYYILINGKQGNKNTKILIAFSYSILVISKYFSLIINENQFFFKKKIYNYIKLNYLTFCILFLFSFDYYINIYYSSSLFTKIFYMILIFIMTFLHNKIVMKVRIILYGIHFFEFLPEIRKFYQSFSNKSCYISYFLFTIYNIINLFYISENRNIYFILIFNVFVIVIYPFIFNYYYKKEKW